MKIELTEAEALMLSDWLQMRTNADDFAWIGGIKDDPHREIPVR